MTRASIVMPTHNRAHLVGEAIASVLAQTMADFELLVVDDGSSDGTAEAVIGFDDPRIVYIRQENAGRSAARNRGLAAARGGHVAFLDDDDLFLPQKLSQQLAFLEAQPEIGLVAGGAHLVDAEGFVIGAWRHWEDQPELTLRRCLDSCPLMPSVVLLRRRELDSLDHWFDPGLEPAEDTDLFLRLLLSGCRMAWLPETVSAYRVHAGSSQWDGTRYSQAYQRILDKLFASEDLPESIQSAEAHYRARYSLVGALRCYATRQIGQAQEQLVQALKLQPELATEEFPSTLAKAIAGMAESPWVDNPVAYVDMLFNHLPASLGHIRRHRGEALGALYMGRVFRASRLGLGAQRDWLLGAHHDPRWLRNRGVWSIVIRSLTASLQRGP